MKFVNKFHYDSILPFCICRIKSGSVIQTKHFDIKMSLEIRQAKSFFFTPPYLAKTSALVRIAEESETAMFRKTFRL